MVASYILDTARAAENSGGFGGARRDRTDDLKLAKLALSQLSYGPEVGDALEEGGGPGRI